MILFLETILLEHHRLIFVIIGMIEKFSAFNQRLIIRILATQFYYCNDRFAF